MIVRLHLHQDMDILTAVAVAVINRTGDETLTFKTGHHCRIVLVGREHILGRLFSGVADHLEQGLILSLTIDNPIRIENLVTAVLGVGLREHHQFNVGRIPAKTLKALDQIVDFIIGKRQAQIHIGPLQRRSPAIDHIYSGKGSRFGMLEQRLSIIHVEENHLRHAIMQYRHRHVFFIATQSTTR